MLPLLQPLLPDGACRLLPLRRERQLRSLLLVLEALLRSAWLLADTRGRRGLLLRTEAELAKRFNEKVAAPDRDMIRASRVKEHAEAMVTEFCRGNELFDKRDYEDSLAEYAAASEVPSLRPFAMLQVFVEEGDRVALIHSERRTRDGKVCRLERCKGRTNR